jgi:protein ImuB
MMWLAVHLPLLSLDALGPWPERAGSDPNGSGPALAAMVIEQHRVHVCSAPAYALGVRPGLRAATAGAFAPQAISLPRDEGREAVFLAALALALARLTPQVSIAAPMVLLEVQASLRLFGGIARLRRLARGIARAAGATVVRLGVAPTPLAAALLARGRPVSAGRAVQPGRVALSPNSLQRALGRVPLALLAEVADLPPAGLEMLTSLGARTLADLRRLPRAGLARRIGGAWLSALDRACGSLPDTRRWITPPPDYRAALELPHRADHAEPLLIAAGRLLQGLAGWLALHWRAAQAFELVLRHERLRQGAPDAVLLIELAEPSRDAAHLLTVLRERLQRHALAAPVYALELRLVRSQEHAGRATSWLADAHETAHDITTLIDRLRARLGAGEVQRLVLREDARPEYASQAVPPEAAGPAPSPRARTGGMPRAPASSPPGAPVLHGVAPWPGARASPDDAASPGGAPSPGAKASHDAAASPDVPAPHKAAASAASHAPARHDAPAPSPPLPEAATLPRPVWLLREPLRLAEHDGRPLHGGPLTLVTRAERIEHGWFDGHAVRRDYHAALGEDGVLRWVCLERGGGTPQWYLHGLFG